MIRFRFNRRAEADLREIGHYIARDNPRRAASFILELQDRCRRLVQHPNIGAARPELGMHIRSVPFGRYVILYRVSPDLLEIRRVLHAARDLPKLPR